MSFKIIRHADRGTGTRVQSEGISTREKAEAAVAYFQSFYPAHDQWAGRYTIEEED